MSFSNKHLEQLKKLSENTGMLYAAKKEELEDFLIYAQQLMDNINFIQAEREEEEEEEEEED